MKKSYLLKQLFRGKEIANDRFVVPFWEGLESLAIKILRKGWVREIVSRESLLSNI